MFLHLPGHYLSFNLDLLDHFSQAPTQQSWWTPTESRSYPSLPSTSSCSSSSFINQLTSIFDQSVSLCSESDVPYCVFLSGGIVSSLILASLSRFSGSSVPALTISFSDSSSVDHPLDESVVASEIASYLNADHHILNFTLGNLIDLLPLYASSFSEPIGDISCLPSVLLSQSARSLSYKVALSGEGSDELFAGYYRHLFANSFQTLLQYTPRSLLDTASFIALMVSKLSRTGLRSDRFAKIARVLKSSSSFSSLYIRLPFLLSIVTPKFCSR